MNKLNMMTRFLERYIGTASCLIPDEEYDLSKWCVMSNDQFANNAEYWKRVQENVGDAPSTLQMIYPKAYLKTQTPEERAETIKKARLATKTLFETVYEEESSKTTDGFIYVKRQTTTGVRKGVMMCIDLKGVGEGQPFVFGQGTCDENVQAMKEVHDILEGTMLEASNIIMLANDKDGVLFGHDSEFSDENEKIYSVKLMEDGGQLEGYDLKGEKVYTVADAVQELLKQEGPTLVCVAGGDALKASKEYFDEIEEKVGEIVVRDTPIRYALVEVVNIYDDAVVINPLHKILKNVDKAGLEAIAAKAGGSLAEGQDGQINIKSSFFNGSMNLGEDYLKKLAAALEGVEYECAGCENCAQKKTAANDVALIMPELDKFKVFDYIAKNGEMPKDSFILGKPKDQKYYLETRRIVMI